MNAQRRKQIASSVHSACLHVLRVVRPVDAESGLSPARLSALSVLVFGGPRTIGGLAAAEGVRSPTMTALVNGLEADGLVRRAPAATDQRSVVVEATPAGTDRMRTGQARRVEQLDAILRGLDDGDLATLEEAARILDAAVRSHLAAATGGAS